jgi:hypothetical protein
MKYYPVTKKWRKIKPFIETKEVQDILVDNFNKFTSGIQGRPFKHGMIPADFEGCIWDCGKIGRRPEYWNYVKHAACHWLVNFNLKLAMLVEPKRQWRIVSSQKHSTVWDGEETLFDFNFLALGIDPDEAFKLANKSQLKPGRFKTIYVAERSDKKTA